MNTRTALARVAGSVSTWTLKNVFRRPAANFPGKAGLRIDPLLIADLRSRLHEGVVVVTGTNGKTTATNLLADAFEKAGKSVACNRTGANLDSGVATALLQAGAAGVDWGILESDELWLAKIVPQLKPDYVVLLNLFRDQLDRMGEIDHMQAAIVEALKASPSTTLVYNTDDPLCQAVAAQVENVRIPFGIDEDLKLPQNTVADSGMCQMCDSMLDYEWRQYGQLGAYRCPTCGFARETPAYAACNVALSATGATFVLRCNSDTNHVSLPFPETYMLYNALAAFAAADCCGVACRHVESALASFSPQNGRLQEYEIGGHHVLLNLAKNPTGFNQNVRIVMSESGPKAAAFFINDNEADGHDVSWLWDVDFQELADAEDLMVYAGGVRRNDLQVRLKYAGVDAQLVEGATDFLSKAHALSPNANLFLVANYTALPSVKAELDTFGNEPLCGSATHHETHARAHSPEENEKLVIVHLYPELLNLYGDGGNVTVLEKRARWRGIDTEVVRVGHGDVPDLSNADMVFLGGGPDREQHLASLSLVEQATALRAFVESDGVLLAICGGYQMLGHQWILGDESVPGLGILDIETKRAEGGSHNRLVGNIALESPLAKAPVIGYENHAGRTFLGNGCEPFGLVIGKHGKGNNGSDGADGVRYRNVVGSYLHGPLLAKNPEVADWLIERALARRALREGKTTPALSPLDNACERAANEFMRAKLGI